MEPSKSHIYLLNGLVEKKFVLKHQYKALFKRMMVRISSLVRNEPIEYFYFEGSVLVTATSNQATFRCRKLILAIPPTQISKGRCRIRSKICHPLLFHFRYFEKKEQKILYMSLFLVECENRFSKNK